MINYWLETNIRFIWVENTLPSYNRNLKKIWISAYVLIYFKTKILDSFFLCQKGQVQGWLKYGLCCFYIYFLTSIRYIQICLSSSPFSKWTTADKKPERLAISCLDVLCKCIHHPPNVYTISQWFEILFEGIFTFLFSCVFMNVWKCEHSNKSGWKKERKTAWFLPKRSATLPKTFISVCQKIMQNV